MRGQASLPHPGAVYEIERTGHRVKVVRALEAHVECEYLAGYGVTFGNRKNLQIGVNLPPGFLAMHARLIEAPHAR